MLNGTKMACYDQIKMMIVKSGMVPAGIPTQFMSAFGAGFFMATTVAPFDMVRTRLMNQPPDAKLYNGFADCLMKVTSISDINLMFVNTCISQFANYICRIDISIDHRS